MLLHILASALLWMFAPAAAFAQYGLASGTINNVGSSLPFFIYSGFCSGSGACGFVEIAEGIVDRFRPALTWVALLVIVIAGYRMIIGQEDDALTKARATMTGTISGLIMVYLIDPFIHAFFGSGGEVPRGAMEAGVAVATTEIEGVINWALTIVAGLAILMIIISALKAVGKASSEEGVSGMRQTLFSVAGGILLLVFRVVLSDGFIGSTGNPIPVLAESFRLISYVMGFLGLIAVGIVVFAGFQYVLSFGKEEQATKSKSLLLRAALGAIVILVSLALVNFVIIPGVQ